MALSQLGFAKSPTAKYWKVMQELRLAPCPSNVLAKGEALNLQLVRRGIAPKALNR